MKTLPRFTWIALPLALCLIRGPAPASAQVGIVNEAECRCVDKDGKEIENCRCFRTFEPGQFSFDLASFTSPRARIGITLTITTSENDARGARIQSVLEDGPADRAGLREGDVITHIDGRSLFDPLEDKAAEDKLDLDASLPSQRLLYIAKNLEPGDEVEVRYLRDGEARATTLQAEESEGWGGNAMFFGDESGVRWSPGEFQGQWEGMTEPAVLFRRFEGEGPQLWSLRPGDRDITISGGVWSTSDGYLNTCPEADESRAYVFLGSDCLGGLRVEKLNPRLGEYFGTEGGVLVADVHPDSKLGVVAGDVILRVGERDATAPDQLRRILRSYEPDEEVTLHIMRQKREMTVSGTLAR